MLSDQRLEHGLQHPHRGVDVDDLGADDLLATDLPGNTDFVYAVDVNGTTMAVVARHYAGSSAQDVAELEAIVDSIRLEP